MLGEFKNPDWIIAGHFKVPFDPEMDQMEGETLKYWKTCFLTFE